MGFYGVVPEIVDFSDMMEIFGPFTIGLHCPVWVRIILFRQLLIKATTSGLDHGELSQASKHIVVGEEDRPCILDFETASNGRRVSNVTSVCHFLFMSGRISELVSSKTEAIGREDLLATLKEYKKNRTRGNFEVILRVCLLRGVD